MIQGGLMFTVTAGMTAGIIVDLLYLYILSQITLHKQTTVHVEGVLYIFMVKWIVLSVVSSLSYGGEDPLFGLACFLSSLFFGFASMASMFSIYPEKTFIKIRHVVILERLAIEVLWLIMITVTILCVKSWLHYEYPIVITILAGLVSFFTLRYTLKPNYRVWFNLLYTHLLMESR
jgi:hypothetical protein